MRFRISAQSEPAEFDVVDAETLRRELNKLGNRTPGSSYVNAAQNEPDKEKNETVKKTFIRRKLACVMLFARNILVKRVEVA